MYRIGDRINDLRTGKGLIVEAVEREHLLLRVERTSAKIIPLRTAGREKRVGRRTTVQMRVPMSRFSDLLKATLSEGVQASHLLKRASNRAPAALLKWISATEKLQAAEAVMHEIGDVLQTSGFVGGAPGPIVVTLTTGQVQALDAYISAQPDPPPSRSEAIQRAVQDWLTGLGLLKHRDDPEGANGRD